MAETTPRYQSINIMKPFPFKLLAYVCLPSPGPDYFPPVLSKFQFKLEQIGLDAGWIPTVMTQTRRTRMLPMRTTSQKSAQSSCRMQSGPNSFHKYHELVNPTSQDMKRSVFREPPIQMVGILDKNIISGNISGRLLFGSLNKTIKSDQSGSVFLSGFAFPQFSQAARTFHLQPISTVEIKAEATRLLQLNPTELNSSLP